LRVLILQLDFFFKYMSKHYVHASILQFNLLGYFISFGIDRESEKFASGNNFTSG